MKQGAVLIVLCMLCSSCDYFDLQQKQVAKVAIVASVGNEKLTKSDIENLFPGTISKEDSLVLLKSIITNWATQKLLLKKAEENSTLESNKEINKLVTDYRNSLIINNYKEKLVKQKLDTVVSEEEIDAYYESNSFNFRLNEELVKIRYLRFGNTILDKIII